MPHEIDKTGNDLPAEETASSNLYTTTRIQSHHQQANRTINNPDTDSAIMAFEVGAGKFQRRSDLPPRTDAMLKFVARPGRETEVIGIIEQYTGSKPDYHSMGHWREHESFLKGSHGIADHEIRSYAVWKYDDHDPEPATSASTLLSLLERMRNDEQISATPAGRRKICDLIEECFEGRQRGIATADGVRTLP